MLATPHIKLSAKIDINRDLSCLRDKKDEIIHVKHMHVTTVTHYLYAKWEFLRALEVV